MSADDRTHGNRHTIGHHVEYCGAGDRLMDDLFEGLVIELFGDRRKHLALFFGDVMTHVFDQLQEHEPQLTAVEHPPAAATGAGRVDW